MSTLKRFNGTAWETLVSTVQNKASLIDNDSSVPGPKVSDALNNLIENPSSKSNGQILGYNGTSWEAIDKPTSGVWGQITGTLSAQTDLQGALDNKQNVISDLDTIRSGAALGATAIQSHQSLSAYRTSSDQDVIDAAKASAADLALIQGLIPSQATSSNQLADKDFVNSSIGTNTANYISDNGKPFTSVAALEAYTGTVTNNDYAFVTGTDTEGNTYFDRYKATVSGDIVTWAKEYRLNNSSFTAAQWAAISSGITSSLVASISEKVPKTTKVNGHALSSDITIADTDIAHGTSNIGATLDSQATAIAGKQATIDASNKLDDTLVAHGQSTVNAELTSQSSQIVLLNSTVSGHTTDILNLQRRTKNNITSNLANLPTAIAQQNLEKYGYAIGDYFVGASGYTYWLADMDTYYGGYNSYAVVGTHHCAVVVDTKSSSQWDSASTAPRYDASALHTYLSGTVLNNVKSDLNALFGSWSSHIISHEMLANGIGTWGWSGANYIRAMTELEVYGSRVWSADNYQQGEAVKQLELFRKFRFNEIFGNTWFWLRSLSSSSNACYANNYGYASNGGVTHSSRASGIILLY